MWLDPASMDKKILALVIAAIVFEPFWILLLHLFCSCPEEHAAALAAE